MSFIRIWLRARRKAVVAFVVTAVTTVAAKHGFGLTVDQVAAVTTVVTTVFVYLVPNVESGV